MLSFLKFKLFTVGIANDCFCVCFLFGSFFVTAITIRTTIIANYGEPIPNDKTGGFLVVPGYSIYWGMPQADVIKTAMSIIPSWEKIWSNPADSFEDIQ